MWPERAGGELGGGRDALPTTTDGVRSGIHSRKHAGVWGV